ncbi:hypothetical protein H5410_022718 [Solanum commersonii]|uniref:Uncharacterized protein n=1 Tax=Solanum commersonii TaxID=4109 RepID=A0A9J5ZG84_SOLCO|nr:hypothetical protein H5410_022718 [Solanum commersonii]
MGSFDDASGTFKSTLGYCLGKALGSNLVQMDPYCLCPLGNELIGNFRDSARNATFTLEEMSNFAGNQVVGGVMVMDMSSPGLLHMPPSLHQVSTDVSGFLNVPSPNCGSNLTKTRKNCATTPGMYPHPPLMDVIIQPYMMKPKGPQVPLVPIRKLKTQAVALVPKSSKKVEKKKRNNLRVEVLVSGFFEKHHGRVLTIDGPVNGTGYSGKYGGKDHSSHCGRGGQRDNNQKNTNKAVDEFVYVGCGYDPLENSLYVPRNVKLVEKDGNLIIQSVLGIKNIGKEENFSGNKSPSSMVVSIPVDPKGTSDADGDGFGRYKVRELSTQMLSVVLKGFRTGGKLFVEGFCGQGMLRFQKKHLLPRRSYVGQKFAEYSIRNVYKNMRGDMGKVEWRKVWTKFLAWRGIHKPVLKWHEEVQWALTYLKGQNSIAQVYMMTLAGTIYCL